MSRAIIDARPQFDGSPAAELLIAGEKILDRHLRLAKKLGCSDILIVRENREMPEFRNGIVLSTAVIYAESSPRVVWKLRHKDDVKNAQGELERSEFFTISKHTLRPLGRHLARWLYEHTPLTANHLTVIRILSGLCGAYFFLQGTAAGNLIAGAIVLFSWFMDLTDGQLARLRGEISKFGSYLDSVGDGVVDNLYYLAISWALYQNTGSEIWILLGASCLFGKYVFVNSTLLAPMVLSGPAGPAAPALESVPVSGARRIVKAVISKTDETDIRYHALAVSAILNVPFLMLWFHALYFNLRWMLNLINAFYKFEIKKEKT